MAPMDVLVLAFPNQVFFPSMRGAVDVPRRTFDEVCQYLEKTGGKEIGVVALRPPKRGAAGGPYEIGTLCQLVSNTGGDAAAGVEASAEGSGGSVQMQLEGKKRFKILKFIALKDSPVRMAKVEVLEEPEGGDQSVELQALVHSVQGKISELLKQAQDKIKGAAGKRNLKLPTSASLLADMVGAMMTQLSVGERQRILETLDVQQRMEMVMDLLQRETEAQKMSSEIHTSMQKAREAEIRQAILQRQIQEVQKGLQKIAEAKNKGGEDSLEEGGEDEGEEKDETIRLAEMIEKAQLPEDAKRIAKKELKRLKNIQPQHPEYTISHTYLETLISLPWKISSKDRFDIGYARKVLDDDHRGLEKVKKRILEFLAVQKMRGDMRGPILCLHGPPGIGKTSLGKSIARSLGREFHRISLGGVRDEAELRGHRRTYIGSMPGNIIQAFQALKVNNPVILLDEVDKMSNSSQYNPQASLLEILDPEQNYTFKDHYVNCAFDLSKVLFIATANDTSLIDRPLVDRMEVIELSGYTVEEKVAIAQTHLLPKQRRLHALEPEPLPSNEPESSPATGSNGVDTAAGDVAATPEKDRTLNVEAPPTLILTTEALRSLIVKWTAESGVRNLERSLAKICRWSALRLQGVDMVGSKGGPSDIEREAALKSTGPDGLGVITVDAHHLQYIVGVELFEPDIAERLTVGVAMGLSVSAVGGQLLFIEATRTLGKGRLTITGQLGKVMLESVETAMSLLRGRFMRLGDGSIVPVGERETDSEAKAPFKDEDIHIHFPAGGIPKDGPSAGVAILLALSSLLLDRPMRSDTAVTGEVALRGHVLPVGGLRDKILTAHRSGLKHVLVPMGNKRHVLEEVPGKVLDEIEVHYLKHVDEAFDWAFGKLSGSRPDGSPHVAEQWAPATTELPPGVSATAAASRGDMTGVAILPPGARL